VSEKPAPPAASTPGLSRKFTRNPTGLSRRQVLAPGATRGVAVPPGWRHGYPAWHTMAGWLPVTIKSSRFHHPVEGAATGPSRFDYMTGNIRVVTPEFHVDDAAGKILDPDWVELPLTPAEAAKAPPPASTVLSAASGAGTSPRPGKRDATIWWHRRYRSTRKSQPDPSDNGREGAFEGEASSAPPDWHGAFDPASGFIFFVQASTGKGVWRRPASRSGEPPPRVADYIVQWRLDPHGGKGGAPAYVNDATGKVVAGSEPPPECDIGAVEIGPDADTPAGEPPAPTGSALAAVVRFRVLQRGYTNRSGTLRKAGGGTRLFGSRSYKSRWVVFRNGRLSYFADETAARKLEKRKDRELHLDNYSAVPDASNPKRFGLEPILPRTEAAADQGKGAAEPARAFLFEADSKEERDEWVTCLGGSLDAARPTLEDLLSKEHEASKKKKR